jgi:hypothetical protein
MLHVCSDRSPLAVVPRMLCGSEQLVHEAQLQQHPSGSLETSRRARSVPRSLDMIQRSAASSSHFLQPRESSSYVPLSSLLRSRTPSVHCSNCDELPHCPSPHKGYTVWAGEILINCKLKAAEMSGKAQRDCFH